MKWFGAAALTAMLLSGCGSGRHSACSQVGCISGVGVRLPGLTKALPRARLIDVCVAGQCTHDTVYETYETGNPEGKYVPRAFLGEARGLHGLGPYPVAVTVRDGHGKVLLRVERSVVMEKVSPNGVVCGPTCFGANLKLDVNKRALEPVPRTHKLKD